MTAFPVKELATLRTPFYYYDLALLRETLDTIQACLAEHPNYHVHYAVKANANPRILQTIAQAGLGADCVSGGEVLAARAAGIPASRIVYAGVGKTDEEINAALDEGIFCFNVESLPELEVINELAARKQVVARVAFRVNPNVDAHTHEKITTGLEENKFGIAMTDLVVYEHLCTRINELQDMLQQHGLQPRHINVGGGLGVDYDAPDAEPIPPFSAYFSLFARCLQLREGQELHFELGRSVVAQCGTLIARTTFVKCGHARRFVIVDAGFTDLIRPAMYGAHHFTQNLSAASDAATETYDVVGPICESSDVFSRDEVLPLTRRGDLIAFRSAGAYGEVMASTYNCRRLPEAHFSEN